MGPQAATILAAAIAAGAAITGSVLTFLSRRENRADHGSVFGHIVKLHDKVDHIETKVDDVQQALQDHVAWEETVKYSEVRNHDPYS